jgi:hypothetical protein
MIVGELKNMMIINLIKIIFYLDIHFFYWKFMFSIFFYLLSRILLTISLFIKCYYEIL